MNEQDQKDERRPLLQAAPAEAKPPSVISLDVLQLLLRSQLSQASSRFSSMVEDKLQSFKRELSEHNASSLESAFKRLKKHSYIFKNEGNKRQYEHQDKLPTLRMKSLYRNLNVQRKFGLNGPTGSFATCLWRGQYTESGVVVWSSSWLVF